MVRSQMSPLSRNDRGHVVVHAGSVGLAVVTQVISEVFFTLAKDSCVPNALFQTSHRNVSETFPLDVTMDWWSESFWILVDLLSKAWLLYAVISLFRRNVLGPESCNPEIHPPVFYLLWTIINTTRMCSMFLWDRQDVVGAIMLWSLLPALSFYMLYMSHSNLDKHKAWLAINSPSVIPWTRYLSQNGLAVFACWALLKTVLGLGIVFKYKAGVPDPVISTIVLTIILLCGITWFVLQRFLLNKYLRYTYGVYTTLIMGLGAMFTRSYQVQDFTANTAYCGFLMLLMTILNLVHLTSECLCTDKPSRPLTEEPRLAFGGCETVYQPDRKPKIQI